jgi:hypothetical protein
MKASGKPIEVHWYDEGHLGGGVEQEIQHQELMMRFAYRVLADLPDSQAGPGRVRTA